MEYHSMRLRSALAGGRRGTHLALSVINGIYYKCNVYGQWIKGRFPLQQGPKVIFHCSASMGVVDLSKAKYLFSLFMFLFYRPTYITLDHALKELTTYHSIYSQCNFQYLLL